MRVEYLQVYQLAMDIGEKVWKLSQGIWISFLSN